MPQNASIASPFKRLRMIETDRMILRARRSVEVGTAMRACRLLGIVLLAGAGLAKADVTLGKVKARACAVCHGAMGIAVAPDTPHLAGQPERYLGEQLKAYRSGKRTHDVMSLMAKPLTDDDIRDLSEWFSSLTIEVKPAP